MMLSELRAALCGYFRGPRSDADRAVEQLGAIIRYAAMDEDIYSGKGGLTVRLVGATVAGVPLGDWDVTIRRPNKQSKPDGADPGGLRAKHESAVGEADGPNPIHLGDTNE